MQTKKLKKEAEGGLSSLLNSPLQIGAQIISNRLVFAPMAYVGNIAQRALVDHYGGCGLFFSEMCSSCRIPHERPEHSLFYTWRNEERERLVVQIVGNDKKKMADAARRVEAAGLFGVDINMGCSTKAICSIGAGAALLKDPESALAVIEAVRAAVRFPVMVKYRIGWKDDPEAAVQMAKRFEALGVDALTFHPRVAPDKRTRPPKWEYIGLVKQEVKIPVFGNGNVFSREDCFKMMTTTGCDGVSLGRIAIAQPWVFSAWTQGVSLNTTVYADALNNLSEMMENYFPAAQALRRFRRMAEYFCTNFRFGHSLYKGIFAAKNMEEIRTALKAFFSRPLDLALYPNLNLFS